MKNKKMVYLGMAAFLLATAYFGWKTTARGAYESAEYTIVESDGSFEIRDYPELTLVTTKSQFAAQGEDGSFMRLFRYISGSNESEQKVAMTTPVFMQPDRGEVPGRMGFVIPKQAAKEGAPRPTGEQVQLEKRTSGRFAVVRFSGRMTSEANEKAEQRLREWIAERGHEAEGEAEFAGYDPPWTPGPLRRNEVLLRLKHTSEEETPAEK